MAATQGYMSGQEIPLDDLPSWKRELILRKRANARTHGAMGLPVPTPMAVAGPGRGSLSGPSSSTPSPLSGPQEATCSLSGTGLPGPPMAPLPRANTTTAVSTCAVSVRGVVRSEDVWKDGKYAVASDPPIDTVTTTMHHKGLHDEGPRVTSASDSFSTLEEELHYGPGIVSKLKNRYMSLAMRETRSRPSLRRFSSLEDLLDSEPRGTAAAKPRAAPDAAPTHRREVMRRARSVDSLSSRLAEDSRRVRTPAMAKSKSASSRLHNNLNPLGKEDVIIIETSRSPAAGETQAVNGEAPRAMELSRSRQLSSSSVGEEEDLPPPDTVRHVKRIFEPSGSRPPRGTAARIAAHKAAQSSKSNGVAPASKPALKAKPAVVPPRKVTPPSGPAHPSIGEAAKISLKKVTQVVRPTPRSTLSVRAAALNGEGTAGGVSGQEAAGTERVRLGLTPVTSSVTAPAMNGDPAPRQARGKSCSAGEVEEGVRRVSSSAVSNIRSESQSQEFNFTDRAVSPPTDPKPASPTPSPLPASPIASHRVPSHSPPSSKVERVDESDRVHLENLKNVEKSRSPPVEVHTTPALPPKAESPPPKPSLNAVKQGKVEPGVPDPRREGKVSPKKGFTRKVEPKPEVRSVGETEPARPSPPLAEELVRGVVSRGGLVEAFNKSPAGGSPGKPSSGKRDRWHQQENTTLVFNFTTSKKETPDYIENDGVDLSRRRPEGKLDSGYVIMPGWDGRLDSSTDGDDLDDSGLDYLDSRPGVTPAPSGIVFEGEAVIINGRSNLQRQPRSRKLKITFDDALTSTFEYPSENYLLEEAGLLPAEGTDGPSASQGRGRRGTSRPMVSGTCSVTIQVGEGSRSSSASHHKSPDHPSLYSPHSPDAIPFPSLGLLTSAYHQDHKAFPLSSCKDYDAEVERTSKNIVKGPRGSFGKVGSVKFGKKAKKLSPSPAVGNDIISSNKENRTELTAPHTTPPSPKPVAPHSTPTQTPKLNTVHSTSQCKPDAPPPIPKSVATHSTPPPDPVATHAPPILKPEAPHPTPMPNGSDMTSPPKPNVPHSTPPLRPHSKLSPKTNATHSTPPPKPGPPHSTPPPKAHTSHSTPPSDSSHSIPTPKPKNRRSKRRGNIDASHSTQAKTPSHSTATPKLDAQHTAPANPQHSDPTPIPRNLPLTPTPKPRTYIPHTETNRDAKSVSHRGGPQIPDVVSMTQRMLSPNSESVGKSGTKSTFRINKVSAAETLLDMNTKCENDDEFLKTFSSDSPSIVQSQKLKNNKDSFKQMSHLDAGSGSSINPLHTELSSKFTTSSSSDKKISCLRKVKTKEPSSVKELFSDYNLDKQQSRTHDELQYNNKSDKTDDELQYNNKSDKTVSYAENMMVSSKLLPSPLGPIKEETVLTKSNSKIYDFTSSPSSATTLVSNYRDRSKKTSSEFPITHHQSLRVPKNDAGTEDAFKNSFTRGIAARKTISMVDCVVQL